MEASAIQLANQFSDAVYVLSTHSRADEQGLFSAGEICPRLALGGTSRVPATCEQNQVKVASGGFVVSSSSTRLEAKGMFKLENVNGKDWNESLVVRAFIPGADVKVADSIC